MTIRPILLAAAMAAGTAAEAATIYTVEADYLAALGDVFVASEGFGTAPGEQLLGQSTTFASGITLDLSPAFSGASQDTSLRDGVLRLSIDNAGKPRSVPSPLVTEARLTLPRNARAFSFEFGFPNQNSAGFGRGVGNDSGTSLAAGTFVFDFADDRTNDGDGLGAGSGFTFAPGNGFVSGGPNGVGYTGFFGVIGAPGERFTTVAFFSNGTGGDTDDDFTVRNISFAPVPVPAALPLLALGLGSLGALRRRRAR